MARIVAMHARVHVKSGAIRRIRGGVGGAGRSELYLHTTPNWKEIVVHVPDKYVAYRLVAQQCPAGVQVELGTDDG